MASRMVSHVKNTGMKLEEIQNFDAKVAFESWKKLGTKK